MYKKEKINYTTYINVTKIFKMYARMKYLK